ncbi:hypothetical protein F4860DRAFT_512633 [Xylaria cubensis]|nr:hypothetical protein F4860DRAFT_512633 [Xylaria cubensis]
MASHDSHPEVQKSETHSQEIWEEDASLLRPSLPGQHHLPSRLTDLPKKNVFFWFSCLSNAVLIAVVAWLAIYKSRTTGGLDIKQTSPMGTVPDVPMRFRRAFGKDLSPYQGFPDDEKDRLWMEMYEKGIAIRITKDEYDQLINKTERVPIEGYEDDYMVGVDAFHQLHCLNEIRKGFYPRRFNSSMENPDGTVNFLNWLHIDHCIESLRQAIICHADSSVTTFHWLKTKIMEPELGTMHMCRDFSKVQEWTWSRTLGYSNKRLRVENGTVVDYSGWGENPEDKFADFVPDGWNHTVDEL